MAGRKWGWHQLDPSWAELVVAEAGVGRTDTVLDIGAGTGALTAPLVNTGARVIAIERHPERARRLRDRFGNDIVIVQADAADLRLPRRPFRVVASPPYAITTPLLRRLMHPGSRLVSAHLVLQDQSARRWVAANARSYSLTLGRSIPRRAFRPEPHVNSRILVVHRR